MNQLLLLGALALAAFPCTVFAQEPTNTEPAPQLQLQEIEQTSPQFQETLPEAAPTPPVVQQTPRTTTPAPTTNTPVPVVAETPTTPPPAPTEETPPEPEEPLIDQYRLKKDKNFKAIEFELAKELALNRTAQYLAEEDERLFAAALYNLNNVFGSVSEPQKEETYFEYEENSDTGEFVVVLVKDAYVKALRGDICQVGTRVFLKTSVQEEFTAKLGTLGSTVLPATEMSQETEANGNNIQVSTSKVPSNVTEIECYNDERPTYSQRVVN